MAMSPKQRTKMPGKYDQGRDIADNLARMMGKDPADSIDLKGLLREVMVAWGGEAQFAKDMRQEWLAAKEGGVARQRMAETFMRMVTYCTTNEINKPPAPSELSNEDLRNFIVNSGVHLWKSNPDKPEPEPEPEPAQIPAEPGDYEILDDLGL